MIIFIQDLVLIAKDAQSFIKANKASPALTGIEQTVCIHIYILRETNQSRLAKMLLMDKGNMAKILSSLEREGCIKRGRNPGDRREKIVSLTSKGKSLIQQVINLCAQWEENILNILSEKEAAGFKVMVEKISQNLDSVKGAS